MGICEAPQELVVAECVDAEMFKKGMRHLAAACTIITTAGGEGWAGLTATAVVSVTADPARLLVCINRRVWAHTVITKSKVLSVNVLAVDQEPLAKRFAGMSPGVAPETRFLAGQWKAGLSGAPVLEDALVSFDCQVIDVFPGSSHDMFLCSVINVSGREGDDRPLIYYNGMFGAFGECPTSI